MSRKKKPFFYPPVTPFPIFDLFCCFYSDYFYLKNLYQKDKHKYIDTLLYICA